MATHTGQPEDDKAIIRDYVIKIVSQLGSALYATFNPELLVTGSVQGEWEELGTLICDFGEYLDAD